MRTRIHAVEWVHAKSWQNTRLTRSADTSTNQQVTTRITQEEVCYTEVMTEARESERSGLDIEEVADGRCDAPMDMAMEMATAVTSIAAETAGPTIFEPMERNENRKRRRRSRMQRTIRQQAQELMQLDRTVGHLGILWEVRAAHDEAQWHGMMALMQDREQKWDAHHEDDNLWGAGITNMIAKVMKGVAPGQEVREKPREKTARMDGGGLESSQHADTT